LSPNTRPLVVLLVRNLDILLCSVMQRLINAGKVADATTGLRVVTLYKDRVENLKYLKNVDFGFIVRTIQTVSKASKLLSEVATVLFHKVMHDQYENVHCSIQRFYSNHKDVWCG